MKRAMQILALAGLATGAAQAQSTSEAARFEGDWTQQNPAACVLFRDDENFAFHIEAGVLQGLESSCDMQNPVAVRGMSAILFDMQCSGEGETWNSRALFMLNGQDQLIYVQDGSAQIMSRCTNVSAPPSFAPSK